MKVTMWSCFELKKQKVSKFVITMSLCETVTLVNLNIDKYIEKYEQISSYQGQVQAQISIQWK